MRKVKPVELATKVKPVETPAEGGVPEDIASLLVRYRDKGKRDLSGEEFDKLASFLSDQNIAKLVTGPPFKYNEKNYNTLIVALKTAGYAKAPREVKPAAELEKHERAALAEHIKIVWDEVHSIAMDTITKWETEARGMGYYDENEKKTRMKDFVKDAIDFYITEGVTVREIQQENIALGASIEVLTSMYNELKEKLMAARMAVMLTEAMYQDVEALPFIITPIKSKIM